MDRMICYMALGILAGCTAATDDSASLESNTTLVPTVAKGTVEFVAPPSMVSSVFFEFDGQRLARNAITEVVARPSGTSCLTMGTVPLAPVNTECGFELRPGNRLTIALGSVRASSAR